MSKLTNPIYYAINEKSIDDLSYDIKEAFSYFQIAVPDTFRESIDGETNKLGDIVIDIVSFIKKNGQRNMKWTLSASCVPEVARATKVERPLRYSESWGRFDSS